jgi:hypothetical protein
VRRLIAIAAVAALTLSAGVASAFTPHVSTWSNAVDSNPRVLFTIDTHTAHHFSYGGHTLFSNAQLVHHNGVWSFDSHTAQWRVRGHWVDVHEGDFVHTEVHGSVCNLVTSPSGCPDGHHLQHWVALAKSDIKDPRG